MLEMLLEVMLDLACVCLLYVVALTVIMTALIAVGKLAGWAYRKGGEVR